MKITELIALACAVTAGSVAFNMMSRYMDSYRAQYREYMRDQQAIVAPEPTKPKAELATVVTVQRTLTFGYEIRREDLKLAKWPADAVPEGAYRRIEDVFKGEHAPRIKLDVGAGEVLLHSKVNTSHQGSAIAMLLPPGLRAVTIKINEIRGVAGFVRPSDRVDILLTEKSNDNEVKPNLATRVLLQNVLVLGIDQDARVKSDQPRVANSMTVAVALEDAQKLALASTVGFLSLALRHPQQPAIDSTRGVSLADLKLLAKETGGGSSTVQVVRATKSADYTVPQAGGGAR
jgi:pilus assembly protein CpaB